MILRINLATGKVTNLAGEEVGVVMSTRDPSPDRIQIDLEPASFPLTAEDKA
jgi:hypothetical protein